MYRQSLQTIPDIKSLGITGRNHTLAGGIDQRTYTVVAKYGKMIDIPVKDVVDFQQIKSEHFKMTLADGTVYEGKLRNRMLQLFQ